MAGKKQAPETTALALFDEELAQYAQEVADQEKNVGGGQFFSIRGAQLSFDGNPIPGNQMAVVVLDGVLLNTYYADKFNPEQSATPICYAFGRDEATIAPHAESTEPQADGCMSCPKNQWKSGDNGKGKACTNRRRLALISAGAIDASGQFTPSDDPDDLATAEIGYLQLPPTSLKAYAAWAKSLQNDGRRLPPFAVYVLIAVEPDPKTQFAVTFQTLGYAPPEAIAALIARHKQVREEIEFPFQVIEAPAAAPAKPVRQQRAVKAAPPPPPPPAQRAPPPPPPKPVAGAKPVGRPSSGAKPAQPSASRAAPPAARGVPPPRPSAKY